MVATLGVGAYFDWRFREVHDALWIVAGIGAALLGAVVEAPRGATALLLWGLVSVLVLEHVLPWDVPVERHAPALPGLIEAGAYIVVGIVLGVVGVTGGIGPSGLPLEVLAVFLSVLIARALFEAGVLYGGADAKAIMVAGLALPVFLTPLVPLPSSATAILAVYPFSLTLLMDAALLAVAVPIGLALRNARRGTFEWGRGFTGYRLPVRELPDRFVWLRDPTFRVDPETEVATSEEDTALRRRQAAELLSRGVHEVWVTPQLPFIVFLWAGAVAGVLVGNLLFDLLALL